MRAFFDIRLATRDDLAISSSEMKIGQVFCLISMMTDQPEGLYQITEDTDPHEIKKWLDNNMIYVPISPLSNNITIENENQHN